MSINIKLIVVIDSEYLVCDLFVMVILLAVHSSAFDTMTIELKPSDGLKNFSYE